MSELSEGTDEQFFVLPDIGVQIGLIDDLDADDQEKAKQKQALYKEFNEKSERIHTLNQLLKAFTLFKGQRVCGNG